ncbi:hypothetical protein CGMCC3_g17196 [Colletotrichum fructicola]|uniref:Uncharacterized protein n=1 Tax=Colletotrichum fructicola (strain Nara gc5) TaxID=1213859 RepID=L2FSL4_COLFN|nr:uncharacterized protein CGMCC3_g17196 [Colletotrichum fructicola]KAF4474065.1 hypothetical protein CGGC5_v016999 [Colletotrichum fructicola Nara gc5]KAE9566675.1 hypothetical protein CGMCC3_g17196 [Colletotrichum fructicola]KAF4414541.1 hypothetical protein CFRS1_v015983 [Colletotrichum fructicola]KAF4417677.1 hypothetical protein CFRS1_v015145 [Colletotrichum fructicola]KAF4881183.1 hypothetical protein CGCFRS4_v015812 [Colletotrichum fructicola]
MSSNEVNEIIRAFQSCLTEQHCSTKAPKNFDANLERQQGRASKKFLEAGLWQWFLFHIVSLERTWIAGKLDNLSDSELSLVITEIGKINVDSTIVALRDHTLENSFRAKDRKKRLVAIHCPRPDVEASSPKRLRQDHPQQTPPTQFTIVETETLGAVSAVPMFSSADQDVTTLHSQVDDFGRPDYENPEARTLPFVFTRYICDAISKTGSKASIKLFFPPDPKLTCMVIEVKAREVARISDKLFDVHIREEGNRRTIVLEHGPVIEIFGSFRLKRVDTGPVQRMMGNMISSGIQNSQQRADEIMEGRMFTDCLSMMVGESAESNCHLTIQMDAVALSTIYQSLWSAPNAEM